MSNKTPNEQNINDGILIRLFPMNEKYKMI